MADLIVDGTGIHKQTNADRIRLMNDIELAEFLRCIDNFYDVSYGDCFTAPNGVFISSNGNINENILDWLQSEVEE